MNKLATIGVSLLLSIGAMTGFQSCAPKAESGTFEAGKGSFLLNGEPFVVKAAECIILVFHVPIGSIASSNARR